MAKRIVIVVDDLVHERFREFCNRLNTSMQQEVSEYINSILRREDEGELADKDNRDDN